MMDAEARRALLEHAIRLYGEPAQMDMAVEEMAELTKAICKVKRASCAAEAAAATENAVEEMADVQIMPGAETTDAGYRPHWATCPQAGQFKRGGRARE